jgi:hypothetical protein
MKKRSAEKVIARSILALATYRKTTMSRALRRRPRFWTVSRPQEGITVPAGKRLRLEFGDTDQGGPTLDSSLVPLDGDAGSGSNQRSISELV